MASPDDNGERRYYERRFDEMDRRHDLQWRAHEREHVLIQEALKAAKEGVDHRLAGMNELREQINAERGRYVHKSEFDVHSDQLQKQLTEQATRISTSEHRLNTIIAAVSVLGPIMIFVINLLLEWRFGQ